MSADEIVRALRCCGNTDTKRPDCEHCPANGHMCVKHMLEGAADLIESLQAQLAESQRRERAAVKDWKIYEESGQCDVCKYGQNGDCTYPEGGRCKFEWRGKEAGEGEAR